MKKVFSVLMALVMLTYALPSVAAEETSSVYSYDFDLAFQLNAGVFPQKIRSRISGYAELINMLEFKGNITYCADSGSFDMNLQIIPKTNTDASIELHFFGLPEYIGVTSPLFGEETLWLDNIFLMEFAFKTWNNLRIPLQYIALLFPYVTSNAFEKMTAAWKENIAVDEQTGVVPVESVYNLAEAWKRIQQTDSRLIYWIASVSALSDTRGLLEKEFAGLPDYLVEKVALEDDLTVTLDDSSAVWKNKDQAILFTRQIGHDSVSWSVTLPETENGYIPCLALFSDIADNQLTLNMSGSYRRNQPDDSGGNVNFPESVLDFSAFLDSWPTAWPADHTFSAGISMDSIITPHIEFELVGSASENGSVSVMILRPGESVEKETILSCSGTVLRKNPSHIPDYHLNDFHAENHISIYNISDKTMDEFIHRIWRPLFLGIMDFLNEVPAKTCQSIMDDLEDYGVLDMISGE